MSAFSKGRAVARRARRVGLALTVMLLLPYAGCSTSAMFPPGPGYTTVEFHIDFADSNFVYGTYEFAWDATCQGCAAEPANVTSVSCKATFERSDLWSNEFLHGGDVVLPAFPLADHPDIHCLPALTSEPQQGTWLYQLTVKGIPADAVVFNSSCIAEILGGPNVIRHTELSYGELFNECAAELGGT